MVNFGRLVFAVGFDGGGVAAGGRAGVAGRGGPRVGGGGGEEEGAPGGVRVGRAHLLRPREEGRRRGGAVAASPPTEEAVQMTEPLTKEDLVAYLVSGCKPKENWR
jgi:glutamate--cysteine ligase